MEITMKTIMIGAACALLLTTGVAAAQSSQGKGGAAMTGESADPSKTPGAGMAPANQPKSGMTSTGTSGMSNSKNMGGANKNGDGQMTKGGMNK
jgi:hypothetical protein